MKFLEQKVKNLKESQNLILSFWENVQKNKKKATVLGFYGDLGVGKTTLIQFLAKNLGIKEKIKSPTFIIYRKYKLKNKNYKNLYHFDVYRLKNSQELLFLGWSKILANPDNLIFIEWPENIKKALPKNFYKIKINYFQKDFRKIKFFKE